jgi:hypothetical protein
VFFTDDIGAVMELTKWLNRGVKPTVKMRIQSAAARQQRVGESG